MITMRTIGADLVERSFGLAAATFNARAAAKVRQWGFLLEGKIKAKASGRPGPRVITGDYRRSITTELGTRNGEQVAIVGTSAPQGRRLEFGFIGTDSRGRHNQAPLPHFRPAVSEIDAPFTKDLASLADLP